MQADGSQTEKGKGAQNPVDQSKVKNGYHPYQKPVEEETRRKLLTKNLLGELKPVHQLKEGEGEGEREREGLEKNSSGVDLELSLKRKECLDLELKLGF
ncbi:hypothetical protein JCGZ_12762 [Jatropha curcas]|uniref:Uncharacterized protein n=2 Tax=Jatropha curcas TaxID=180498 RepID=A0A067KRL9_JATCU|nr:hypothetical protein JCGZ_12762 [Jatropha curcas]